MVAAAALPAGRGGGGFAGGSDRSCSRPGGATSKGWQRPRQTVLVFEDLHWADEALLAFLEHLAEWAEGVPLLLLCTARPELYERHPGWAAGHRETRRRSTCRRSRIEETAELVSHLITTSCAQRGAGASACWSERAGNPLYAEEFVRLLADRDLGADEMELPESLQALIAARLDTLTPERKSLLQDAAVLGKVFWVGRSGRDRRPRPGRARAGSARAGPEGARPPGAGELDGGRERVLASGTCSFAMSPTARSRGAERARRHRAAAAWIERKAGERVEDLAEVLAYHYLQALELAEAAGDTEQAEELARPARRFLALAGERALGLDTAQAEARLARALELCPADDPERPELLAPLGRCRLPGRPPARGRGGARRGARPLPRPRRERGRKRGR